jgi:LAO/AO transport system kinase
MARLAALPTSFIRPSPSRGASGGIARDTAEAVLLCEAAGYSVVLVETLGTGQSEHAVADLVDALLLVLIPGAGDELQGMKRGAIELADVIAVNKADGLLAPAAERAAADLTSALGLLARGEGGVPAVLTLSAREERGLDALWHALETVVTRSRSNGAFERRRRAGLRHSLFDALERALRAELALGHVAAERDRLESEVLAGQLSPRAAASRIVALARGRR